MLLVHVQIRVVVAHNFITALLLFIDAIAIYATVLHVYQLEFITGKRIIISCAMHVIPIDR